MPPDSQPTATEPAAPLPLTHPQAGQSNADFCSQPPQRGQCRGAFTRWHFNPASGACTPFLYGGCGSNANNFESLDACAAAAAKFCLPGAAAGTSGASGRSTMQVQLAAADPAGAAGQPPGLTAHDDTTLPAAPGQAPAPANGGAVARVSLAAAVTAALVALLL